MQADGMSREFLKKILIILMIFFSFFNISYSETAQSSPPPTLYVDDNYDESTPGWQIDHFDNIQSAITASSSGTRIIILEGNYVGKLTIYHRLDIFGENKDTTIIDGQSSGDVITINSPNVNISHLTIKKSGNQENNSVIKINSGNSIITDNIISNGKIGIFLNNCDSNIIYDNEIKNNNGDGIYVNHSDNNQITYDTINSNSNGIFLYNSNNNRIENLSDIKSNRANGIFLNETSNSNDIYFNNLSDNADNGIFLNDHCNDNIISNNDISLNGDSGIRAENSSSNSFLDNIVESNSIYGVMIVGSSNIVSENIINSNTEHGVFLFGDDLNQIKNNQIKYNKKDGVHLINSTSDNIHTNLIHGNLRYGTYLDFFTIDNYVYNNYYYQNYVNAVDKSITRNFWNSTQSSATNIIGGDVIFGNYWDDYDELSENAFDTNSDQIADDEYTVYNSNKDYGPILDSISPTAGTPYINPDVQTIGSDTYISSEITDNTEIKDVYLVITDPTGAVSNFSIFQNNTGDTYYCNKKYTKIGNYSFYILGKDPRNWVKTITKTFEIEEGQPPSIVDNSPTSGNPDTTFTFNASVTDDNDGPLDMIVKVNWKHGGNSGNYTMLHAGNNYFNIPITLDNSSSDLTYSYFAADQWGNSITTSEYTVTITDDKPPEIVIDKNEYSSDGVQYFFTISSTITDDTEIDDVTITYWKEEQTPFIAKMDKKANNCYEKVISLSNNEEKIFCIINTTDLSGNANDTQHPFAHTGGPYQGVVSIPILFDASNSFDLDGNIINWSWDFGDGTTGSGETVQHSYQTNGVYEVSLTIQDDDGYTKTDNTNAEVIKSIKVETSLDVLNTINSTYHTSLDELFFAYDTDGDSLPDIFHDPNGKLTTLGENRITNEDDDILFIISCDNDPIPEFFWDSTNNELVDIGYKTPINSDIEVDLLSEKATMSITVEKQDWICIGVSNPYPDASISVKTGDREIDNDMVWRSNGYIYILDDPNENYEIYFNDIFMDVTSPTFKPDTGEILNENQKSITITYNVPVKITYAAFNDKVVTTSVKKTEDNIFVFTPAGYLEEDYYLFEIEAEAVQGTSFDYSTVDIYYIPYTTQPIPPEKSFIEKNIVMIYLGFTIGLFALMYLIMRKKNIHFESFIYFKNKKIIPFFKPVVFGPLKIDVNDNNITKAEFYVNGMLKQTITEEPYVWNWDEPAFLKQKIKTKIYDNEGKSYSSDDSTFYVFNLPSLFNR